VALPTLIKHSIGFLAKKKGLDAALVDAIKLVAKSRGLDISRAISSQQFTALTRLANSKLTVGTLKNLTDLASNELTNMLNKADENAYIRDRVNFWVDELQNNYADNDYETGITETPGMLLGKNNKKEYSVAEVAAYNAYREARARRIARGISTAKLA